ncbi:MAG: hypothetical protein H6937_08060 [Burkholderiales bacterium]|nr:hypothetical protein [Burkholderiales bacterium]
MDQYLKPNTLVKYFRFYNENWKHQTLKATPDLVYDESIKLPKKVDNKK